MRQWPVAVLFTVAGVLHFVFPAMYARIVPPYLPAPSVLVAVSGVAEIAGGLGMLWPATRRAAGWGLIALLVAVLPANIYMGWALWFRVPMQAVLIWWVWWASLGTSGLRSRQPAVPSREEGSR